MGASTRQYHARVEAERQAGLDADRIRREQEAAQAAYAAQIEAMRKQAEALKAPKTLQSTLDASNVGVRTGQSTKRTTANLAKGVSSLRIPLNLGNVSKSSLNIG